MSAVSKKLMPASSAASMIVWLACSSVCQPKFIVPERQPADLGTGSAELGVLHGKSPVGNSRRAGERDWAGTIKLESVSPARRSNTA